MVFLKPISAISKVKHVKRLLISGVLFYGFNINSNAQLLLGFQSGTTNHTIATNISNQAYTSIGSNWGYSAGITSRYQFPKLFFVQTSLAIMQKNYSINRTDSLTGIYIQHNNTYLQLPLMAGVMFGKRLTWYAGTGAYVGWWLAGRLKGKIPNIFSVTNNGQQTENFQLTAYNQKYNFNTLTDNRIELGWVAGVGMQYTLIKKYTVFTDCIYYEALTVQQKKYMLNQVPRYSQTFNLTVGIMYSLK